MNSSESPKKKLIFATSQALNSMGTYGYTQNTDSQIGVPDPPNIPEHPYAAPDRPAMYTSEENAQFFRVEPKDLADNTTIDMPSQQPNYIYQSQDYTRGTEQQFQNPVYQSQSYVAPAQSQQNTVFQSVMGSVPNERPQNVFQSQEYGGPENVQQNGVLQSQDYSRPPPNDLVQLQDFTGPQQSQQQGLFQSQDYGGPNLQINLGEEHSNDNRIFESQDVGRSEAITTKAVKVQGYNRNFQSRYKRSQTQQQSAFGSQLATSTDVIQSREFTGIQPPHQGLFVSQDYAQPQNGIVQSQNVSGPANGLLQSQLNYQTSQLPQRSIFQSQEFSGQQQQQPNSNGMIQSQDFVATNMQQQQPNSSGMIQSQDFVAINMQQNGILESQNYQAQQQNSDFHDSTDITGLLNNLPSTNANARNLQPVVNNLGIHDSTDIANLLNNLPSNNARNLAYQPPVNNQESQNLENLLKNLPSNDPKNQRKEPAKLTNPNEASDMPKIPNEMSSSGDSKPEESKEYAKPPLAARRLPGSGILSTSEEVKNQSTGSKQSGGKSRPRIILGPNNIIESHEKLPSLKRFSPSAIGTAKTTSNINTNPLDDYNENKKKLFTSGDVNEKDVRIDFQSSVAASGGSTATGFGSHNTVYSQPMSEPSMPNFDSRKLEIDDVLEQVRPQSEMIEEQPIEPIEEEEYEVEEIAVVQEVPQESRKIDLLDAAPLAYIAVNGPLASLAIDQNLGNVQALASMVGGGAGGDTGKQCCECMGPICSQDICATLFFIVTIPFRLTYYIFSFLGYLLMGLYNWVCHPVCFFWCDKDGSFTKSITEGCGNCTHSVGDSYSGAVQACSAGLGSCALGLKDHCCIPVVMPVKDFIVSGFAWLFGLPFTIMHYIWIATKWPFDMICGTGVCAGVDGFFHSCGNVCSECKTDCFQCCGCEHVADCCNGNFDCCNCPTDLCHHFCNF
jgi:hypothetical protein